jgi:cob(I)alamin adenosyltransferase
MEAASAASLDGALAPDGPPEDGVHLLVLDEILYAAERSLIDTGDVVDLIDSKTDRLELVLTGGHREPAYLREQADLITRVRKEKHPFDSGVGARRGTEY